MQGSRDNAIAASVAPAGLSLAEKLSALLDAIRPEPGGRKYTLREVTDHLDPSVAKTSAYLAHLVRGTRSNPTAEYLCELANFFGVEPVYLLARRATDDQRRVHKIHSGLLLLHQLQGTEIGKVLIRARASDERTAAVLVELLDVISPLPGATRTSTLDTLQLVAAQAGTDGGHKLDLLDAVLRLNNDTHSDTLSTALRAIASRPAAFRDKTIDAMDLLSRLDERSLRTVIAMLHGILDSSGPGEQHRA